MAAEVLRCSAGDARSRVCAPSRPVPMTEFHVGHTWVRDDRRIPLRNADLTLAELRRVEGGRTGLFGRWGAGNAEGSGHLVRQGFERSFGDSDPPYTGNSFPDQPWDGEERVEPPAPCQGRASGARARPAIATAGHRAGSTGSPWLAIARCTGRRPSLPLSRQHRTPRQSRGRAPTARGCPTLASMGTVLAGASAPVGRPGRGPRGRGRGGPGHPRGHGVGRGHAGPLPFGRRSPPSAGNDPEFADANGPFRVIRRSLPEGGIRVPFNVWWPGVVPAAPVEGALVHLQDLFAAAGTPAGAVVRAGLDSRHLLPTLKGVGAPTAPLLYRSSARAGRRRRCAPCHGRRSAPRCRREAFDARTWRPARSRPTTLSGVPDQGAPLMDRGHLASIGVVAPCER